MPLKQTLGVRDKNSSKELSTTIWQKEIKRSKEKHKKGNFAESNRFHYLVEFPRPRG